MERPAGDVSGEMRNVTRASWSLAHRVACTEYKVSGQSFVVDPMDGVTVDGEVGGMESDDDSVEGLDCV